MKLIRGFGKNYFALRAIQAYSSAQKLHSRLTSASFLTFTTYKESNEFEDEDPPPDLLELPAILEQNKKICLCHKHHTHFSRLTVLINHYIPRCPYYTTYFAFRRTGVHPPLLF